ncbi:hypothetical protein K7432_003042 [Basidiobolus ranarum]|uniref:Uncharacterized protein n=1 Tax=Basidiobolus ranarum TaxID=34480 RepID=A0ABR2X0R7_9FUNG
MSSASKHTNTATSRAVYEPRVFTKLPIFTIQERSNHFDHLFCEKSYSCEKEVSTQWYFQGTKKFKEVELEQEMRNPFSGLGGLL